MRDTLDEFRDLATRKKCKKHPHLQMVCEYFEDDRSIENYKFIVLKEIVEGFNLAEKVKDMTKIELAHMIHNYASCISEIDLKLYQYKTEKLSPKNIIITY